MNIRFDRERLEQLQTLVTDSGPDQNLGRNYEADEDLAAAVNVALILNRPLLVWGRPDAAKPSLATPLHETWGSAAFISSRSSRRQKPAICFTDTTQSVGFRRCKSLPRNDLSRTQDGRPHCRRRSGTISNIVRSGLQFWTRIRKRTYRICWLAGTSILASHAVRLS